MDNMATGYAFGMAADDFGNIDFQHSMQGEGPVGQHHSLMPGLGPFTSSFTPALTRDSVFSQTGMLSSRSGGLDLPRSGLDLPRSGGLDLPRFHEGAYGEGSSASFNHMMQSRHHPFPPPPGMQGFGDMFPQSMPGVDGMEGGIGSYGSMMSSTVTSSSSSMVSSMPVFPNNPPLLHSSHNSHGILSSSRGQDDRRGGADHGLKVSTGGAADKHSSHSPAGGGRRSPMHSPRSMQSCFPPMSQPGVPGPAMHRAPSPEDRDELRDFSGGPAGDPMPGMVIGSEVTPMQRKRPPGRRGAAMAAQEMAAAAAAALAIETKQAPMPPFLSSQDSHLLSVLPHNMAYPHPSMVHGFGPGVPSDHPGYHHPVSRRGRRPRSGSEASGRGMYHTDFESHPEGGGFFPHDRVVPFFKAGRIGLREPEVFDCGTAKVPLITQGTQTGQDSRDERPPLPVDKPISVVPSDSRFANINPRDGKGGFPLSSTLYTRDRILFAPQQAPNKRLTPDGIYFTQYTEGAGYAKRGNSKTIVSPSFGDAAARAVMTTSVGDHSTIVTVAIMSRKTSVGGCKSPRTTNSTVSPRPSTSHTKSDDLKENDKSAADGNSTPSDTPSRVQTRRSRKTSSSPTTRTTSSRGRTLRRRTDPDNISIENDENFEELMEERKEKIKAAEQERMEISVRIDDSQCISYGDHKRWQCNECDKSYTTKHNLVMHMLDHQGIKPHLCLVCGRYFKQLSHLNTHMLTHDRVRPHVCEVCNKGFTQISHLKRHLTVHQESKPYSCEDCGKGFTYPGELRVHKQEKHPSSKILPEFRCEQCEEEFPSALLLKQHEVVHEHESPNGHTCSFCHRTFRYPSQLRDHIVIHSNSRPYMCTECGMDFMKEHHLRSHQFTHTGLRPYSCEICGRSFNQRANMQRHMLIHNSERSFKCEYCDKTFTQPQTLKAHMVVHADHKPFQCNLCGKEFGRLHNLHGHMHMHNNSKPYACFCGSSFTLKGNLNRHKKVKHGLNESTESMEEDAVHFLSSWSERAAHWSDEEEGDENDEHGKPRKTDDEGALNDSETRVNGHGESSENMDLDGSSLDMMDRNGSGRKQRKSTPRKIPRRSTGVRKRRRQSDEGDGGDEEEDEEEGEEDEEEGGGEVGHPRNEDQKPNFRFQALTDAHSPPPSRHTENNGSSPPRSSFEGRSRRRDFSEIPEKRSRRGYAHPQPDFVHNGDFVTRGPESEERDEGEREQFAGDDQDWSSNEHQHRHSGKGAKLDSLIAQKFNTL